MKTELYAGVMKTIFSTQDEKFRAAIDIAMNGVTAKARQNASASMEVVLEAFMQAKAEHDGNMQKLEDIGAEIIRKGQERETLLEESVKAEESWRSRFRQLRGVMTPEMKTERSQQVADRELAEEFGSLISEMEAEKERAMEKACYSGEAYIRTHYEALSVYAQNEWAAALQNLPAELMRAFRLRVQLLEMKGKERPYGTVTDELGQYVSACCRYYPFDMDQEPVISQLGLSRPALTGVDMEKYKTPAQRFADRAGLKTGG